MHTQPQCMLDKSGLNKHTTVCLSFAYSMFSCNWCRDLGPEYIPTEPFQEGIVVLNCFDTHRSERPEDALIYHFQLLLNCLVS